MSFDEISSLRPANTDSASLGNAIVQAREALAGKIKRGAELRQMRTKALLTASDREMRGIESEIADTTRDADRITALIDAMTDQQGRAKVAEDRAGLREEGIRVQRRVAELNAELTAEYPELVRRLAEFANRHAQAITECENYRRNLAACPEIANKADSLPGVPTPLTFKGAIRTGSLRSLLRVPSVQGTEECIPPQPGCINMAW